MRYRIVALEVPRNDVVYYSTGGRVINDAGLVAGTVVRNPDSPYPSGNLYGMFLHSPDGGFQDVGDYQGLNTQPSHINNNGQMTVMATGLKTVDGESIYVEEPVRYTPGVGYEQLPDLGGIRTRAIGINAHGTIVGVEFIESITYHATIYPAQGGIIDLGLMGGTAAAAIDINDQGYVTGYIRSPTEGFQAFIYHESEGLSMLGPGRGVRINNRGSILVADGLDTVLLRDGMRIPIAQNGSLVPEYGFGLNDGDVVVGLATLNGPILKSRAFLWTEREGTLDLNDYLPPDSGWTIGYAYNVNNHGQITGRGYFEEKTQAYRLDPIPPETRIALEGTNAVISWSPAWPGIVLEAGEVPDATTWEPLPATTNQVTVPLRGDRRFFRLNLDALEGLCCPP